MNYSYSSISRAWRIEQNGRVKTYPNTSLSDLDNCKENFRNSWGFR